MYNVDKFAQKKNTSRLKIFFVFLLGLLLAGSFFNFTEAEMDGIEATVKISVCGDGIAEGSEKCDFYYDDGEIVYVFKEGQETCRDLNYDGGPLACNVDCSFDATACYYEELPLSPSPGGGSYIQSTPKPAKPTLPTGDFNDDGLINYRDLSILLYWFGKTGSEIIPYDLNGDKKINFVDISILLYRWKD